jgi:CRP-like cAMP-binding protein
MNELPKHLRKELESLMSMKQIGQLKYFNEKEMIFIKWTETLLVGHTPDENDYLYREGEMADKVYFIVKGQLAYVLPKFQNRQYKIMKKGQHFGHLDLLVGLPL